MEQVQYLMGEDGKPAFAVVPIRLWRLLQMDEAQLSDEELLEKAKVEDDDSAPAPHWVIEDLSSGKHPIKVYCKWRGIKQNELAQRSEVDAGYISSFITGKRPLSDDARTKIAGVLNVDTDDLDPWPQD